LRTFTSSFFQTPGRFNLLDLGGKRVVVDYCHNIAGLEAIADFVTRMEAETSVAVISVPGDRSNGDIEAFGTLAARTFNRLVIREDVNTRGRPRGEIAHLLRTSALAAGLGEDSVSTELDELQAVKAAVAMSDKTDLVVLMVDRPAEVWEMLTSIGAAAV
jgi:cyanophycin synthetase